MATGIIVYKRRLLIYRIPKIDMDVYSLPRHLYMDCCVVYFRPSGPGLSLKYRLDTAAVYLQENLEFVEQIFLLGFVGQPIFLT